MVDGYLAFEIIYSPDQKEIIGFKEIDPVTLIPGLNTDDGKKIVGYAATSKSTTILNYCGINSNTIAYICDTTKEKIGKYSPGMHIPIVTTDYFRDDNPDFVYLFAWNHKEEIFNKEKNFTKNNQKWISHVEL